MTLCERLKVLFSRRFMRTVEESDGVAVSGISGMVLVSDREVSGSGRPAVDLIAA
jgi:hypothetical protein